MAAKTNKTICKRFLKKICSTRNYCEKTCSTRSNYGNISSKTENSESFFINKNTENIVGKKI